MKKKILSSAIDAIYDVNRESFMNDMAYHYVEFNDQQQKEALYYLLSGKVLKYKQSVNSYNSKDAPYNLYIEELAEDKTRIRNIQDYWYGGDIIWKPFEINFINP